MRGLLIPLILLVAVPAAIAQTVVVHPNTYLTNEGGANNNYPFNYSAGAGRYQQTHDKTQFTGPLTITELGFRYKGDSVLPGGTVDFKMTLSTCTSPWNAPSGTFASNIGADATVVFNGFWAVPPFNGDPAVPNPFTSRLILTTPFPYDPANGDLLIDCEIRASIGNQSGAIARAAGDTGTYRIYTNSGSPTSPSGSVSNVGLIVEFTGLTQVVPYGTGCAGAGGFVPALNMSGTPNVGNQVTLALDKGLGGVMSALFITAASGSTPIGGSTCTLLVAGNPITLFIPLGGSGAGNGSYQLPAVIPVVSPVTIYMQAFVNDPAGPIGLSASNGLKVEIK